MTIEEVLESILPKVKELIKQGLEGLEDKTEPTFYALEKQTQSLLPLIGNVILQVLTDSQGIGLRGPAKRCDCGNLQIYHDSDRSMYLQTSVGEIVLQKRAYYHCQSCGSRSFPLDEQLALNSSGQMSRYLQEQIAWLFAQLPASRVREALPRFGWPLLSETQIREKAQSLGKEIDCVITKEISKVEANGSWPVPLREEPDPQTERLYAAPDGWMYCTREVDPVTGKIQWREMKVAAVYEAVAKKISQKDEYPGTRDRIIDFVRSQQEEFEIATIDTAKNITYIARTENWEEFGPYLLTELKQRGLDRRVKELVVVADGAPRIDGVVDGQLRSAKHKLVRILDIAHAQQHIWKVSNLAFGESTALSKQWSVLPLQALEHGELPRLVAQFEGLKTECSHRPKVVEEIERAINYFQSRAAQIEYPRFVEEGYQIGSGLAESACKRFGTDRMKGAGMRWNVSGAQATATLRMMLLSNRWAEVSTFCGQRKIA
ncbi:MAG: hypothetical protein NVS9B9_28580 [Ktedonobacteraceae bacterium]